MIIKSIYQQIIKKLEGWSMVSLNYHDGNIHDIIESRSIDFLHDNARNSQIHSSLLRRLSIDRELEGHQGCVNALSWNSTGSLLLSGSDDTRINVWSYASRKLVHSIDTGHSANIFCTKFVPQTSDELVVSGAGDAQVRLFNLSRPKTREDGDEITPSAVFHCHSKRVKKLAVEPGNPNVVWSASEDGTLRQHDFREGSSCPTTGSSLSSHRECRNVLLDLRCGSKLTLSHFPKNILSLKSCDISSTRPHLLIVGGSDAFARLYDRRMLPPLSSIHKRMLPPPCVNFFCPMHLSEQRRPIMHLTHVAFSPDGEEVLLSYSGEHVYVMDMNCAAGGAAQYTPFDVWGLTALAAQDCLPAAVTSCSPCLPGKTRLGKCRKLIQIAEKCLREDRNYFYAIEGLNEVLDASSNYAVAPETRLHCLCIRAALLLKRKWKSDVHMAIRDCATARRMDRSSCDVLYYLAEALFQLGKCREALDFVEASRSNSSPASAEDRERADNLAHLINKEVERKESSAERAGGSVARVISLTEFLHRLEARSRVEIVNEGGQVEYEEADPDLDFEISVTGDGIGSLARGVFSGMNVIVHTRSDSGGGSSPPDGSSSSPSAYQGESAVDMKQRFVGHCNVGTDIKQASYIGRRGEYIASGSDDGRWFVWEKRTGRLVKMLLGDVAVVNCVQCHPYDCAIATSGIDSTIKLWTPCSPVASDVGGGASGPDTADVLDAMETNQLKLGNSRNLLMPFELIERF